MFSAFNPSKCTHLEQWAADTAAPGQQLGVRCLAQGSQLSRGQFLLEPRFEPTTSDYKSNALSTRPRLLEVYSFMHSVLGRGSFSTNSSISEVWHGSDQPVALLSNAAACGTAFSSSVLLDPLFLIFLLKISHRFQMGFRSGMLSGQSSTVISWSANHLEVLLALWTGAKVLLKREISISIKLVNRCKHKVLQNLLVDG